MIEPMKQVPLGIDHTKNSGDFEDKCTTLLRVVPPGAYQPYVFNLFSVFFFIQHLLKTSRVIRKSIEMIFVHK